MTLSAEVINIDFYPYKITISETIIQPVAFITNVDGACYTIPMWITDHSLLYFTEKARFRAPVRIFPDGCIRIIATETNDSELGSIICDALDKHIKKVYKNKILNFLNALKNNEIISTIYTYDDLSITGYDEEVSRKYLYKAFKLKNDDSKDRLYVEEENGKIVGMLDVVLGTDKTLIFFLLNIIFNITLILFLFLTIPEINPTVKDFLVNKLKTNQIRAVKKNCP